jgi:arylsulfatase A
MDKMIGRLVRKLDELGIRENTLVMFVGDNGTDTPIVSLMDGKRVIGSKGQTIDAGTRVPFIANWPSTIPPGQASSDLVTFTDFFQTMCAVADLPSPPATQRDGQSFLPQLKGETGTPRPWIYCFYARNGGLTGKEFARNQRYKLYRSGDFFDVANDDREQAPLSLASLTSKQQEVYEQLTNALAQFQNARPAAVAEVGEATKRRNRERKATAKPSNSRR